MKRFLYVIGQPGSGKTTAVDELCQPYNPVDYPDPIPHRAWFDDTRFKFVTLGKHKPPFSGTDTLGMAVQPSATGWLTSAYAPPTVVAEGDRLANSKFFNTLTDAGWRLTVAYIDTPDELAQQRRNLRGTVQNPAWVKGRITKAERLRDEHNATVIDGTLPPRRIAQTLRDMLLS